MYSQFMMHSQKNIVSNVCFVHCAEHLVSFAALHPTVSMRKKVMEL